VAAIAAWDVKRSCRVAEAHGCSVQRPSARRGSRRDGHHAGGRYDARAQSTRSSNSNSFVSFNTWTGGRFPAGAASRPSDAPFPRTFRLSLGTAHLPVSSSCLSTNQRTIRRRQGSHHPRLKCKWLTTTRQGLDWPTCAHAPEKQEPRYRSR